MMADTVPQLLRQVERLRWSLRFSATHWPPRPRELLLARIRDGEWPLGPPIAGRDHAWPRNSAVGRSTLREAIRELAGRGVLDSRQGAGVFVTAARCHRGLG